MKRVILTGMPSVARLNPLAPILVSCLLIGSIFLSPPVSFRSDHALFLQYDVILALLDLVNDEQF